MPSMIATCMRLSVVRVNCMPRCGVAASRSGSSVGVSPDRLFSGLLARNHTDQNLFDGLELDGVDERIGTLVMALGSKSTAKRINNSG